MSDRAWMRRAIDAASAVVGTTTPNPAVGAVLVRGEDVLGIGATQPVGGHHAEVMALADEVGVDLTRAGLYLSYQRVFGEA